MTLQPDGIGEVVLWVVQDPTIGPKRLFQRVLKPLCPWDGHGRVLFARGALGWAGQRMAARADVVGLCWAELFVDFAGYGPVNAADQGLAVLAVGNSAAALLGCLMASSRTHHGWWRSRCASVMKAVSLRLQA